MPSRGCGCDIDPSFDRIFASRPPTRDSSGCRMRVWLLGALLLCDAQCLQLSPAAALQRLRLPHRGIAIEMRMPDAVLALLPMGVRNHLIFSQAAEANWDALRACYATEEATLAAATECRPLILPVSSAHSPFATLLTLPRLRLVPPGFESARFVSRSDMVAVRRRVPGCRLLRARRGHESLGQDCRQLRGAAGQAPL